MYVCISFFLSTKCERCLFYSIDFFVRLWNCQQSLFFFLRSIRFTILWPRQHRWNTWWQQQQQKKTATIFKQMQQHQQLRTWINGFLNSSLFMADVFIWFDIGCRTFHIINRLSFSTLIQLFQRLAIKSINMFGDYSFIFFCWFFTAFLVLLLLLLKWTCAQTSERERSHRIYHTHTHTNQCERFVYLFISFIQFFLHNLFINKNKTAYIYKSTTIKTTKSMNELIVFCMILLSFCV